MSLEHKFFSKEFSILSRSFLYALLAAFAQQKGDRVWRETGQVQIPASLPVVGEAWTRYPS